MAQLKKEAENILTLWDSYSEDLARIYGLLMDGKGELASVILQERRLVHNGQSRETLYEMLTVLCT